MIVLAGASASGKTEAAKMLAKKYNITKVITTTTRSIRDGEVDGVDYFFVSKEKFEQMIKEEKFVEYTFYNGNYYGSTKDQIAPGKCVVIDPAGLKAYTDLHDVNIVTFFLDLSEELRHQRMLSRGDKPELVEKRISHDRGAFTPDKLTKVDFKVSSEKYSIEEIATLIYRLYKSKLATRSK